jgi:dephospho-CoA kinase
MFVGLTGGIGAGKSTIATMFKDLGATVFDADQLAKDAMALGGRAVPAVLARFGNEILDADGRIDRRKLAGIVFHDLDALRDLEDIVHPIIRAELQKARARVNEEDIVIYDMPLLIEKNQLAICDAVIVVMAPEDVRLGRLLARGLAEDDARARMAVQATDEQRIAAATFVIENNGDFESLRTRVSEVWASLNA